MDNTQPKNAEKYNHYFRPLRNLTAIDPYVLFRLYEVDCHEIGHAIKKLLSAGRRGAKNREQDLREAMDTIQRCIEIDLVMEHYKMLENNEKEDSAQLPLPEVQQLGDVNDLDCSMDVLIDTALPSNMGMLSFTDNKTGESTQVGIVKLEELKVIKDVTSQDDVSRETFTSGNNPKIASGHLTISSMNNIQDMPLPEFEGTLVKTSPHFLFEKVKEWTDKTKPNPTLNDLLTQYAVHIEEFTEMLVETGDYPSDDNDGDYHLLSNTKAYYYDKNSNYLRSFKKMLQNKEKRTKFQDALLDQIWTAIMLGHMIGFDMVGGFNEVVNSNFSKFDENGNPVYKDNGKVGKSELYKEPELSPYNSVRPSIVSEIDLDDI